MNYNMYSNNPNDFIDPNYIYPRPYIDPMMYINPYMMYNNQYNSYPTYTNAYADNPINPSLDDMDNDSVYPTIDDDYYNGMETLNPNYSPNMQSYPNMMPGYPNFPNMMYPMYPPGMFPGMFPGMMPPMFPPGMFPGMMPQINMEEFDEEEM